MESGTIAILSLSASVLIALTSYIASIVTVKNKTDQNTKDVQNNKKEAKEATAKIEDSIKKHNDEDTKLHASLFAKLDEVKETLAEHKVKLANAPSMEQVRHEFVTKEMFKQMEKHIDEKFDKVENGLSKILDKLEKV